MEGSGYDLYSAYFDKFILLTYCLYYKKMQITV
jgi:hypothetical protein